MKTFIAPMRHGKEAIVPFVMAFEFDGHMWVVHRDLVKASGGSYSLSKSIWAISHYGTGLHVMHSLKGETKEQLIAAFENAMNTRSRKSVDDAISRHEILNREMKP